MTTQALTYSCRLLPSSLTRNEGSYFLEALRHIEYGRIIIVTPQDTMIDFWGRHRGPVAQIKLHDWGAFDELVARGEIGFAEAYIDGRWETPDLPELLTFALANTDSLEHFFHGKPWYALWLRLKNMLRSNTLTGSRRNINAHYDLGNDFYALWLDESMTYSCALFENDYTQSLEQAQQAKYQRILKKLNARPGDHILEIGCGWGGFSIAAARAGLRVTALTISEKQAAFAQNQIKREGVGSLASVMLKDYREVEGTFDHIVSIGMFEHVGEEFWPVYFSTIKSRLKQGGTAMVQSITLDDYLFEKLQGTIGFIEHYIFPGGMLPSKARFKKEAERAGLACREMFTFGDNYAFTLECWLARFEARKQAVHQLGYNEDFMRLWRFYLSSCIASFKTKRTDVMQVELTHA